MELCRKLDTKEVRIVELERLYAAGKIQHSPATIKRWVFGLSKKQGVSRDEWQIAPRAYLTLTADVAAQRRDAKMLLSHESEIFMASVIVTLCRMKNGMTDIETIEWARAQVGVVPCALPCCGVHALSGDMCARVRARCPRAAPARRLFMLHATDV